MIVSAACRDVHTLASRANDVPNCIAFNTDGGLKSDLKGQSFWLRVTDDPTKGLYIRSFAVPQLLRDESRQGASVLPCWAPQPDVYGWATQRFVF